MSAPVLTGIVDVVLDESSELQHVFPSGVSYSDDGPAEGVMVTISSPGLPDNVYFLIEGYSLQYQGSSTFSLARDGGGAVAMVVRTSDTSVYTITFNANATQADISAVLSGLAYSTTVETPAATREFTITIVDSDGEHLTTAGSWEVQTGTDNPFADVATPAFTHNFAPALVDVDRDGDLDLLFNAADGFTRIHLQGANGVFDAGTAGNPPAAAIPGQYGNPDIVDIDGDGDLDLVYSALNGTLRAYENPDPGFGTWHEILDASNPFLGLGVGGQMWAASVLDVDVDGDLDLVAGYTDGTLHYFRNDAGTIVEAVEADNPFDGINVGGFANQDFGDVDGDGDLDLVVGREDGGLSYFENVGGDFVERTDAANPFSAVDVGTFASVAFGDVDGDGDEDIVVGGYDGSFTYIENQAQDGVTFTVTVNGVDDPAVANDDSYTLAENVWLDDDVTSSWGSVPDSDPDGPVVITEVNGDPDLVGVAFDLAGGGKVTLLADGSLTFHPDGDFNDLPTGQSRQVSFTYTVVGGDTATVTITVNGVASNGDKYVGTAGVDLLQGDSVTAFDEILAGGDGNDLIYGFDGADSLRGENGDDMLLGGAGNDVLVGGDGADYLYGDDGNDVLRSGGDTGGNVEIMAGGAGDDIYYVIAATDLTNEAADEGADTVISTVSYNLSTHIENLTLAGVADLDGSGNQLANTIIGSGGVNNIWGGDGNDILRGNAGDDVLYGELGHDDVDGGVGNDVLRGGDGADVLKGGAGNDTLHGDGGSGGNDGEDQLYGGAGNDALYGGDWDDTLHGDVGNDVLDGGAGADQMAGGLGDDTYYVDHFFDEVIEGAGQGIDTVITSFNAHTLAPNVENLITSAETGYGNALNNRIEGGSADNILDGGGGDDRIYGMDGADYLRGVSGRDQLYGGAGADQAYGGDDADQLWGEDGNDRLWGENGADILNGGAGIDYLYGGNDNDIASGGDDNDILYGDAGIDKLYGDAGNDELSGGDDNDVVYGGAGKDLIYGGAGGDKLYGDGDNDEIYGEAGNDVIEGGDGADNIWGGAGVDRVLGGDGGDSIYGNEDADTLDGGAGDDALFGGLGSDTLTGGDGADLLDGAEGSDRLTGGAGADTFIFNDPGLQLTGSGGVAWSDTITDFSLADGDKIDLSPIDAIAGGGDNAFAFVSKFTKQAGQALLIESGANTLLRLDVDGDGKHDLQIVIQGVHLTADDHAWIL